MLIMQVTIYNYGLLRSWTRENNPHKLTILDVHRLRWP
jgi:hypothetical protein